MESIILFSLTIIYTAFLILRSKGENVEEEQTTKKRKWWVNLILVALGLTGIIFGGKIVVNNASKIAMALGMSEMLVGLTIVAIGTSLPELVTSIVAAKKGENDIAIGNAIGSCLFNIVLILGFCSILEPYVINVSNLNTLIDVIVMFISALAVFLFSIKSKKITRWQGIVMVVIYVIYFTYIVLRDIGVLVL